jgi:nucleoid-associated protein YgaU
MPLERASFTRLNANFSDAGSIEVQYNPTEFTLQKGAQYAEVGIPGLDMPIQQYVRGQAETLMVDLFFDTTEFGMDSSSDVTAVTLLTDQFYHLIRLNPTTKAPPICRFDWGERGFPGSNLRRAGKQLRRNGFQGVLESVTQKFTLFSPKGIPLRATLAIKMREYQTLSDLVAATKDEVTLVEAGKTLDEIASRKYNDPARWRQIAELNDVDDPLNLSIGSLLSLLE